MNPNAIRTRDVHTKIGNLLDTVADSGPAPTTETMVRLVEGLMARMPQPKMLVNNDHAFAGGRTMMALRRFIHGEFELSGVLLDKLAGKRWDTLGHALQIRLLNGPIDVTYIESDFATTSDIMNAYLLAACC
jgi:hypothetical protein